MTEAQRHIAIVGGGASGTWAALQLAQRCPTARLTLLDAHGRFARGLAYSAPAAWHRLNVPAQKMGGRDDDDPQGFANWLAAKQSETPRDFAETFVARHLYRDYLAALLEGARAGGRIDLRTATAISLDPSPQAVSIGLEEGTSIIAERVVLCLGNQSPRRLQGLQASSALIDDVWQPGALLPIGRDDDVIIIGTGATAIDAVIDLESRNTARRIHMVSRNGLLPCVDARPPEGVPPEPMPSVRSVRLLMRTLRERVEAAAAKGIGWQHVVDDFRVHLSTFWREMPDSERRRFIRHVRAQWLVHRHRLAPDVAAPLQKMQQSGRLRITAGRVLSGASQSESYALQVRVRGGDTQVLTAAWVLNCTGPEEDFSRVPDPLIRRLLATGSAKQGPMGIGLAVDDRFHLLDADGRAHDRVHLIGPPTRGCFWEVTAVPHLRAQAIAVADEIAGTPG